MGGLFDIPGLRRELSELKKKMDDPTIWADPKNAQNTGKKVSRLQTKIRSWEELNNLLNDSLITSWLGEGDISFCGVNGMSRDI